MNVLCLTQISYALNPLFTLKPQGTKFLINALCKNILTKREEEAYQPKDILTSKCLVPEDSLGSGQKT